MTPFSCTKLASAPGEPHRPSVVVEPDGPEKLGTPGLRRRDQEEEWRHDSQPGSIHRHDRDLLQVGSTNVKNSQVFRRQSLCALDKKCALGKKGGWNSDLKTASHA